MSLKKSQKEKLLREVRLHTNWFLRTVLGDDVLTADERKELESFKKLPERNLSIPGFSYGLGRLKAILKPSVFKKLNLVEVKEKIKNQSLTSLEKLTKEQAQMKAGQYIRQLLSVVSSEIVAALSGAVAQAIAEASTENADVEEAKQRAYGEVASSLATDLHKKYKKDWEKISRSEVHYAKQHAIAQAVINKVGVYSKSAGIDSDVSIVPKPGTCPDCAKHYLDKNNNPKVFKLRELISSGTNENSSHKKTAGVHYNWKTTLPPLHPNCRCTLVYVPPGYSWVSGQLRLTDRSKLHKALEGQMGPKSTESNPGAVDMGPGLSGPANVPGVSSPQGSGGKGQLKYGQEVDHISKDKVPDRPMYAIADTKKTWVIPKGAHPEFKSAKTEAPQDQVLPTPTSPGEGRQWGMQEKPSEVVMDHLKNGNFTHVEPLGDSEPGTFEAYVVTIQGNGRGLLKPAPSNLDTFTNKEGKVTAGEASVPFGSGPQREASAHSLHEAMGLSGYVPETTMRNHEGRPGSLQSFKENYTTLGAKVLKDTGWSKGKPIPNSTKHAIDSCPADKRDAFKEKVTTAGLMHVVMNSGDAHKNNILVSEDYSDIKCIDNSAAFGHGMSGTTSSILMDLHNSGHKITIPESFKTRLSNMTYHDVKRATPDLEAKGQAETYLRMKYLLHAADEDGDDGLDVSRFAPICLDPTDGQEFPRTGFCSEAVMNKAAANPPHDRFVNFVTQHMSGNDPSIQAIHDEVGLHDLTQTPKGFYQKYVEPHVTDNRPKREESWRKRAKKLKQTSNEDVIELDESDLEEIPDLTDEVSLEDEAGQTRNLRRGLFIRKDSKWHAN
jgi:hypothetical protein